MIELFALTLLATIAAQLARRGYRQFTRVFEYSFASLFGLFGTKLLWDGLKELRT